MQQTAKVLRMLTGLWIEEDGRVKSTASLTSGGAGAALAEGGFCGGSPAPGPRSSARGAPAMVPHGQGGTRVAGGEVIPRTRSHLRRRVRWNSRAGGLRSREQGTRWASGRLCGVKLRACQGGAVAGRPSHGGTARWARRSGARQRRWFKSS